MVSGPKRQRGFQIHYTYRASRGRLTFHTHPVVQDSDPLCRTLRIQRDNQPVVGFSGIGKVVSGLSMDEDYRSRAKMDVDVAEGSEDSGLIVRIYRDRLSRVSFLAW